LEHQNTSSLLLAALFLHATIHNSNASAQQKKANGFIRLKGLGMEAFKNPAATCCRVFI
jgi:hypothetical protein